MIPILPIPEIVEILFIPIPLQGLYYRFSKGYHNSRVGSIFLKAQHIDFPLILIFLNVVED